MAIISELLRGSFRGVPFLLISSQLNSGRKFAINEYVGSNKRYIEDLGVFPDIFRCEFTLKTDTNNYSVIRDRMNNALKASGSGQLIHPFYGINNVFVTNMSVSESDNSLGIIIYSVEFSKVQNNINPNFNDTNSIFSLTENLFTEIQSEFNYLYNITISQNALNMINTIKSFLDNAFNIVNSYVSDISEYRDFFSSLNLFNQRLPSIVGDGALISLYTSQLMSDISNLIDSQEDQVNLNIDFFNIFNAQEKTIFKNSSFYIEDNLNKNLFYLMINIMSLANVYKSVTNEDFFSFSSIKYYLQSINNQYEKILSFNKKIYDETVYSQLDEIKKIAINSIVNSQTFVDDLREVYSAPIPLLAFYYKYYGNVDLSGIRDFLSVNNFNEITYISGNIKLISK